MVVKQADALEFVQSLDGGWDCIVWDPPYFTKENHYSENHQNEKNPKSWANLNNIRYRLRIDDEYLINLKEIIKNKITSYAWLTFFNQPLAADYRINWYKGKEYGGLGKHLKRNTEYIMIDFYNKKPTGWIRETEHINAYNPGSHHFNGALAKPIKLYQKLYNFVGATYILDPFAGSYNSIITANSLNIKYDGCDKFIKPPNKIINNLYDFISKK